MAYSSSYGLVADLVPHEDSGKGSGCTAAHSLSGALAGFLFLIGTYEFDFHYNYLLYIVLIVVSCFVITVTAREEDTSSAATAASAAAGRAYSGAVGDHDDPSVDHGPRHTPRVSRFSRTSSGVTCATGLPWAKPGRVLAGGPVVPLWAAVLTVPNPSDLAGPRGIRAALITAWWNTGAVPNAFANCTIRNSCKSGDAHIPLAQDEDSEVIVEPPRVTMREIMECYWIDTSEGFDFLWVFIGTHMGPARHAKPFGGSLVSFPSATGMCKNSDEARIVGFRTERDHHRSNPLLHRCVVPELHPFLRPGRDKHR